MFLNMSNYCTLKLLSLGLLTTLFACNNGNKLKEGVETGNKVRLSYAKGFEIEEFGKYKTLTIFSPEDTSKIIAQFKLYPKTHQGKLKQDELKIPCEKIICLSSTQLAYFIELDATDRVFGLNSSRFLFNKKVKERIKSGEIKRVGKEGNFNIELVAAIDPDVILVSPFKTGGYDAIKNLDIPLLPIAAYNEQDPLGRSEWIKLIALLTGQEKLADSVFNNIHSSYLELKTVATKIKDKPTVFSGKMKSGNWYVPGGKSFIAQLINDAGGIYVFDNDQTGASPLDFEIVYNKAHNVDFWRLQVSEKAGFNTEMLLAKDKRYGDFDALKNGKVLVCNIREKPYYEENPVKPHVILADFIHHFHPEVLPKHLPVYYEFLN